MTLDLVASIIAGVGANLIATAVNAVKEWRDARRKLRETEEVRFQAALAADSLAELGGYLDGPIGSFLVTEYAHNAKVKVRVNAFLARLQQYVGATSDQKISEVPVRLAVGGGVADGEFTGVETRLQEGRLWDALATLRRVIEKRLTTFALNRGVSLPDRPSAGRLLEILRRREPLAEAVVLSLRYAIDVANRGVHGLDVSPDEAFDALQHARRGLADLEQLTDISESPRRRSNPESKN